MRAEKIEGAAPEDEDLAGKGDPDDSECRVTRITRPAIHLSQDLMEVGVAFGKGAPRAVLRHAGRLPLMGGSETPQDAGADSP